MARTLTYATADRYYTDLLACHDSCIRYQSNSILDEEDGHTQMTNLFIMRELLSHFASCDLLHGPFVLNLTDLHGSNIFVDSNWRIKYIFDLEWAYSLPIEMLTSPYWMSNRAVDELEGEELQAFEREYQSFTDIFEEEEESFPPAYGSATHRTDIMRRDWKIGNFWCFEALKSPKGLFNPSRQHIQPVFEPKRDSFKPHVNRIASLYHLTGLLNLEQQYLQNLRIKKET